MPAELCHHVKEDGISCHSPALRGLGNPQVGTGAPVSHYNSIFCDKSFEINYVPRNHGQVIDSTGVGGRGIQLTKRSPDTTKRQGRGYKPD